MNFICGPPLKFTDERDLGSVRRSTDFKMQSGNPPLLAVSAIVFLLKIMCHPPWPPVALPIGPGWR